MVSNPNLQFQIGISKKRGMVLTIPRLCIYDFASIRHSQPLHHPEKANLTVGIVSEMRR